MSHKVTTSKIPAINTAIARSGEEENKISTLAQAPVPIKVFVRTNAEARLSQTSHAGLKQRERPGRKKQMTSSHRRGRKSGFQVNVEAQKSALPLHHRSPGAALFPLLQLGVHLIPSGQVFNPEVLQLRPRRPATDVFPSRPQER